MNKKIISSVLAVAFAFSMAGPVGAITDAQYQTLLDQFNQLTVLYNTLMAQIPGQTTTTGLCLSGDLSLGTTSAKVKILQQGLNQDPATQVAISGAGSPGFETSYFGALTKAAAIKFQNLYSPEVLASWGFTKGTGYAGSTTIAKFNSLYCMPQITPSECTDGSSCGWCGDQCGKVTSGVSCPDVIPPTGVSCVCENNNCITKPLTPPFSTTTTTTKPVTTTTTKPVSISPCQWCGAACMRVYPWMACPQIAPPAGYSCCEINGQCTAGIGICKPNISTTTTTTIPTITASISIAPPSVVYNGSASLYWNSSNARYCTAFASPSNNQWTGIVSLSGVKNIINLTQNTTFSITCSGLAGSTPASNNATVYIKSCIDSDGGKSYYIKGTITLGSLIGYTDSCIDIQNVKEYYCENNLVKNVLFTCPGSYICQDGACKGTASPTITVPPTTTTTTIPIRYTCNPSNWQCYLTYGGGQYDSLSICQARCQSPTTTTTLPPCQWCGDTCTRVYPGGACPDVVPPRTACCEINGQCVTGFSCWSASGANLEESNTIVNSLSNLMASLMSIIESLKAIIK